VNDVGITLKGSRVKSVADGSEAARQGVIAGMNIRSVDGIDVSEFSRGRYYNTQGFFDTQNAEEKKFGKINRLLQKCLSKCNGSEVNKVVVKFVSWGNGATLPKWTATFLETIVANYGKDPKKVELFFGSIQYDCMQAQTTLKGLGTILNRRELLKFAAGDLRKKSK